MATESRSATATLAAVLLAFTLAGCVIVPFRPSTSEGKIEPKQADVIEIGTTTKDDVIRQLGAPSSRTDNVFHYDTQTRGWGVLIIGFPTHFPSGLETHRRRGTLRIAFDDNAVVTACGYQETTAVIESRVYFTSPIEETRSVTSPETVCGQKR